MKIFEMIEDDLGISFYVVALIFLGVLGLTCLLVAHLAAVSNEYWFTAGITMLLVASTLGFERAERPDDTEDFNPIRNLFTMIAIAVVIALLCLAVVGVLVGMFAAVSNAYWLNAAIVALILVVPLTRYVIKQIRRMP